MIPKKNNSKQSEENSTKTDKQDEKEPIIKTKLPKSQYDLDGRPILNVPELDDIDLNSSMNKLLK